MESEDYVLCHWNGDLWPAKVLSRAGTQTNSDRAEELLLHVQILSVEETVQVRSTDVMPLTEAGIEAIASSAGLCLRANELPGDALCKDSGPPGQATAHTEALKVALEILSSRKLAGQGTPVEFPQSEPEGISAQPGPGPCTDKKQQKRKESSESSLGKRACLPSKHADNDKESMAHTETTASPDEMQAKVSNNSTVSAQIPTDDGAVKKECEENSGAATPESSNHLMFWNSPYAKDQFPGLFVRPVVVLNRLKDMRQKSQDSSAQIKVSEAHSVTTTQKGMENSAKSDLHAGLSREGTSSASPNILPSDGLSTANQKRKRQEASFKTEAKKCRVPKTSNKTKNIVNKKEAERRKETRTKNVSPGRKAIHIEKEMLVWFKPKGYPFWPAVVKSVDQTTNTARVLLIEPNLRPEGSGIQVPLCNLKHMECRSKDKLVQRASQRYKLGMAWCLSLISHYEEEIVWKYFNGSFLDYFATSGHFPVRRAMENAELLVDFPVINYTDVGNSDGTTNPNVKTPICSTEGNPNLPECLNGESEMEEREQKEEEKKKKKEGKGKNKKNLEREEENEQTEKDENVEEEEEKGEENQEMEGKLKQKQGEGKEKDEKRGKKNEKKTEKKLEEEIKVEKEEEKAEREGANKTEEGEEDRQEMEEKQEEEEEKELEEQEEENLEEENGEEEKEEELKVSIKEEMEENEERDKNEEKEQDKKKEGKEWEEDTHVEGDEEKSEQRRENEEEEKVKEEKQDVEGDEEENEEEKEEAEEENKNEKGEKKELKEKENVEEEEMAEKEKQVVEEKQQQQEETNMEKIEKKDENDKEETLKMENGEVEKHEKEKMEKEEKEEK